MRTVRTITASAAAAGLLVFGAPTPASAYCILPADKRFSPVPTGPIPVFVSTDGAHTTEIARLGLGPTDIIAIDPDAEIAWIKEAIAIFNEASTDAPRLFYAGTDDTVAWQDAEQWSSRNVGITISTYGPCALQPTDRWADTVVNGNKAMIEISRGGVHTCDGDPDLNIQGMWWTDPADALLPDPPGVTISWRKDIVGTLVHEFGHALGLEHTVGNIPNPCDPAFPNAAQQTANSVMNTDTDFFRRRLRRDDIDGLRALYGAPERTASWSSSTAVPPTSASWVDHGQIAPGTLMVNTPITLSDSSRDTDALMLAGFTNQNDEVRFFTGNFLGWFGTSGTKVPHPTAGQTIFSFDRVEVARGSAGVFTPTTERRMVAWHGTDESSCCGPERVTPLGTGGDPLHTRIWWRIFDGVNWLTPQSTAPTRYKEMGLGFDPLKDVFVLAYLDTCSVSGGGCAAVPDEPSDQWLFVRTINAGTGGGGCTQALTTAGHVLAVGDVVCDFRGLTIPETPTRCVIPVTTVDENTGPQLRYIEGEIKAHAGGNCFIREVDPPTTLSTLALGTPSAAFEGFNTPSVGTHLFGSWVPGFPGTTPSSDNWSKTYTLSRNATTGWVVAPQQNIRTHSSDFWPLMVGSLTRTTSTPSVQWRVITY